MLQFSNLAKCSYITHGITEIGDAVPTGLVFGEQVHKDKTVWVEDTAQQQLRGVDALVTRQKKVGVAVRVADCVPVLFAEPRVGVVGAVHAGWRGTALDITRKSIEFLKMKPFGLKVGIGPAICPNCFVVGEEVARQFDPAVVRESETREGIFHLDLWQANVNQCLELGIPENNIEVMRVCTVESPRLYSFRRGDREQRNIAFIQQVR
ncbi:MAG: polyphenol oxidase family protein [Candidatus Kerfeldbacteria bacterium]|nr:polyphenol oxidase family protein [Candidatus Kerfeldbacteria bacterium]